jgi:hypothetical protein
MAPKRQPWPYRQRPLLSRKPAGHYEPWPYQPPPRRIPWPFLPRPGAGGKGR